jgi:two-component system, chemotaxis family, sensor kinase CheA
VGCIVGRRVIRGINTGTPVATGTGVNFGKVPETWEHAMGEMDDVVKEFLVESYENLDRLDRDFVALETDPTATDRIGSIFRTIHTIKGTCGFLGFGKLESVAHVGENLLSRLRDGQLVMNSEITTGLLKLADTVREILHFIESSGAEGDKDYSAIVELLKKLNEAPSGAAAPAAAAPAPAVAAVAEAAPVAVAAAVEAAPEPAKAHEPAKTEEVHAPSADAKTPAAASSDGGSLAGNAIRVDVGLLDKLMNLVGELVLARNQVLQFTATQKDASFIGTSQRLNLITTELQESVMKTRMQPIGSLWNKFPRIVRDLSQACHKKVRIEMEGKDTELDKTIIEAIKDPLTHIIRNSIDHGVEAPDVRLKKGKPEEGCLFMRAYHEGGQVNIEIRDDGNGVDPERVKRKAIEKGLITAEQSARMSEREAVALIFLPGFSTAEKVTNVSGRGVGMDVVKTNVEKIGGTVDVQSKLGEGTTLRVKIPLTLAIIPALVVSSGGERFAIPQVSLLELVRLEGNNAKIETIQGAPIYRLRGKLLPLVYINSIMNIQTTDEQKAEMGGAQNIVVLRAGEQQFGLVVDQISDTEEIVVKPLGKQLKGINVFAGATIMGDGRVALILDVMGLAQKANVISQAGAQEAQQAAEASKTAAADRQALLLFMLRGEQRMAIPLSLVSRLEEFKRSAIEEAGSQAVVQYRGQIMPLINLAETLGERRKRPRSLKAKKVRTDADTVQVVVFSHENRNIGLRVERILDVVEEQINLQSAGTRRGVQGTAVIKDRVTEVIDLKAVVEATKESHVAEAA